MSLDRAAALAALLMIMWIEKIAVAEHDCAHLLGMFRPVTGTFWDHDPKIC